MTLFTSISSFVQFVVLGRLLVDYAVLLFFVAAVASAVGQLVYSSYIKRTGIIAFILGGVISVANVEKASDVDLYAKLGPFAQRIRFPFTLSSSPQSCSLIKGLVSREGSYLCPILVKHVAEGVHVTILA